MTNHLKPEESKEHYFNFKTSVQINKIEAENLLCGRAIQKEGKWNQLNFNDKNHEGSFHMKEFPNDYGYDLTSIVEHLPIVGMIDRKLEIQHLIDKLQSGERAAVTFLRDGIEKRYYIEANPQYKTVNIYDEHSKKVSIATAIGSKQMEVTKEVHKMNKTENEQQYKRSRMRIT